MRHIRFDSVGGAAGDMILAALSGLGADLGKIESVLRAAIPEDDFRIVRTPFSDYGVSGFKLEVKILKNSAIERSLHEIEHIISHSAMPERAKKLAHDVFSRLAHAEAHVHNCHSHHIHFHEVGAVDSIVDILGSCYAFVMLEADSVSFGTLPEGRGTFKCRHGIYPIPAPATLELIKGLEIEQTDEPFEMITPTGAALLTALPGGQGKAPKGVISASAASFGSRKLNSRPNMLRASLIEVSASNSNMSEVTMLETNIDDISPEVAGFVSEKLYSAGALEVWTTPVFMKKQRPGFILSVICNEADSSKLQELVFSETGTLGIRVSRILRSTLERDFISVKTPFSDDEIKVKRGSLNGKTVSLKPEYEDCRAVALRLNIPVRDVMDAASSAARK